MCLHFTYKVKRITKTAYQGYPYEKSYFISKDIYKKINPFSLIDECEKNGDIVMTSLDEVSWELGVNGSSSFIKYDWIGISYTYFDFKEGCFVVVAPFDFEIDIESGATAGHVSGRCNRRVMVNLHNGFWTIRDIEDDYEV